MSLTVIKTPGFAIPSISQGILADNGKLLFLSGHFAYGNDGKVTAYDVEGQLAQTFNNLKATLLAANAEPAHVARMTIYIRDYTTTLLPLVRKAIDGFANKECPPASALIGVAALFLPEVLVEIDAIAVVP